MQSTQTLAENQAAPAVPAASKLDQMLAGCAFQVGLQKDPPVHFISERQGTIGTTIRRIAKAGTHISDLGWIDDFHSNEHCLIVSHAGVFRRHSEIVPMSLIQILND